MKNQRGEKGWDFKEIEVTLITALNCSLLSPTGSDSPFRATAHKSNLYALEKVKFQTRTRINPENKDISKILFD